MTATSTASTPQSERKVEGLLGPDLALACVNGNASALARILGISPQAVCGWKKKGYVPAQSAKKIAEIFKVSREDLNPKVFG